MKYCGNNFLRVHAGTNKPKTKSPAHNGGQCIKSPTLQKGMSDYYSNDITCWRHKKHFEAL